MRKNDFVTNTEKMIDARQNETERLLGEISGLETEISGLQDKIEAYTDVNDIKTYSDLKNNLEIREHKLISLKRDLAEKMTGIGEAEILDVLNGFAAEKRRIDNQYAEEMLAIIRDLDVKLKEAEAQRESLKALHDRWTTLFKVDTSKYQSYPLQDETGVCFNIQKLVNALRVTGKLL